MSFTKLQANRINFLKINSQQDFYFDNGNNKILISAPHGVAHFKNNKQKPAEIGSLTTALFLKETEDTYFIAKTKQTQNDVNYEATSDYKNKVFELIDKNGLKYFIDIHGISPSNEYDINLITGNEQWINTDPNLFKSLVAELEKQNFKINCNFENKNSNCLAQSVKNKFADIWSIQIEVNYKITNDKDNYERYEKLLDVLTKWINTILDKNFINGI